MLTRFQKGDGTTIRDYRVVPPMQRATIDVEGLAGLDAAEFSTLVEADVQVVVDRTMTWDQNGYGSHAERGILTRTATKWYFAEGATFGPFNLFYLVQNPNTQAAQVRVTYLLPTGSPLVKDYVVGPQSRFNIWVDNEGLTDPALAALASAELSAIIESTNGVPIIAERAMYLDQPGRPLGAGHESAGVTAPATQWFLAEGATGDYFDLFILIANPQATPATVQADYLLTTGQVITRTYTVPANSRFNIWVDQEPGLANAALSTRITSTNGVEIIVERAMWWPGPTSNTWQEAHNSPGEVTTGTRWAFAEGEVGGARNTDTYVLIANTSATAGTIRATVLFEDGTAPVTRDYPIGASARFNIAPAADEFFPETRRKALRHADREHRLDAGPDRRRARDVFGRRRRALGGRHQRPRHQAAVAGDRAGTGAVQGQPRSRSVGGQRHGMSRECAEELAIHRHELDAQAQCHSDELAVVRGAVAVSHEFEDALRVDVVLASGQQSFRLRLKVTSHVERQRLASQISGEDVAELAAPQHRRHPFGVADQQGLGVRRVLARQVQVREDVGVHHNHWRPSRLNASMSLLVNLAFGIAARRARARTRRSAGVMRSGISTDSRHTMASLFRLRRCRSAAAFKRS